MYIRISPYSNNSSNNNTLKLLNNQIAQELIWKILIYRLILQI